jgi:hypothetical protein
MGSVEELGNAIADATARQLLVERCRSEIIAQSYQGSPKGVPSTLVVGGRRAMGTEADSAPQKAEPWRPGRGEDHLFSKPLSIDAGERLVAAGGTVAEFASASAPGTALQGNRGGSPRRKSKAHTDRIPGGISVKRFEGMPSSKSLSDFLQVC